jgi:beta-galactosidase
MREKLLLDIGWQFHKGDVEYRPYRGHDITYLASKAEHAKGAAARDHDDRNWRTVDLPHDYVVGGTPDPSENHDHGCLARENAWYRRTFTLDAEDHDRRVTLLFDGVVSRCTVWVNGYLLARSFTGAIGFEVDFTDVARYGEDVNVVAVHVDNSDFEGWYYEGGGIYRHVWLVKTDRVAVDLWGTCIRSRKNGDDSWTTDIETTVRNDYMEEKSAILVSEIAEEKGAVIAGTESQLSIPPREKTTVAQTLTVKAPSRWSIEEPNLHVLVTKVLVGGQPVDDSTTVFGYRTLEFDAEKGFSLNGKPMKLRGMSNHQDYGGLGVALPDRVQAFRIKKLKAMGCNAYRCAHNPHAPEVYDACDRLGMMVMDETRWFDSSPEGLSQLSAMIKRDRNHPSVIMWSLFNEEPALESEQGQRILASMSRLARKLDPTRPATAAVFFGLLMPAAAESCDIIGINYHTELYDTVHARYPAKALFASETGCGFNGFGIDAWRQVETRPYMMGGFPWTGLQYRGEARWPSLFSRAGAIDQCGQPTAGYFMYKAYWSDAPFVRIYPHWNWAGKEGEEIEISVFTNGDTAELFQDGRSLGVRAVDRFEMVRWRVPYSPGTLKTVAWKDGRLHSEDTVETAGAPVKLNCVLEDDDIRADGEDAAIITAYALDSRGRRVPDARGFLVEFDVNGLGEILAVGSPDPADRDPWKACRRKIFEGSCQVIVKTSEMPGTLVVTAASPQLGNAAISIEPKRCTRRPYVKRDYNRYIPVWRMSPVFTQPPDLSTIIAGGAPDAWESVEVGRGSPMVFEHLFPRSFMMTKPTGDARGFVVYHAESTIPRHESKPRRITLHFECIEGKANAVFTRGDTTVSAVKEGYDPGTFDVDLSGFKPDDRIHAWVLIEANTAFCSVNRPVRWVFA